VDPIAAAPAGSQGSGSIRGFGRRCDVPVVSADSAGATVTARALLLAQHRHYLDHMRGTFRGRTGGRRPCQSRQVLRKLPKNASNQNVMCVSSDGGANFVPVAGSPSGRPRPVFGIEGDVWVPTGSGLYHSQDSATTFVQVPQANAAQDGGQVQQVNSAAAVGFGMPAPGQSYPAVYLAGSVDGVWGTLSLRRTSGPPGCA